MYCQGWGGGAGSSMCLEVKTCVHLLIHVLDSTVNCLLQLCFSTVFSIKCFTVLETLVIYKCLLKPIQMWLQVLEKLIISTTIHAMTKLFVPFCSAQDGESAEINYSVFWAHCENGKNSTKCQVYNKGIFPISSNFLQNEILISLKSAVDFEWNGVTSFVVSCSVAKLFICKSHKIQPLMA